MGNKYLLPQLPYAYKDLEPLISELQLKLHHEKHHQAYVNGANALFEKMDKSRMDGSDPDVKATLKDLSFQIGGHLLHSLFWKTLAPAGKGGGEATGAVAEAIDREFGSFQRFKIEFTKAAATAEGSGWAALTYCKLTGRLLIMQIEKHNTNVYPMLNILLLVDVFEHAYYIDYKNDRAKFIEAFWNLVNWDEANKRLKEIM